ncbi:MAG: hypothetical protein JXA20_06030 [Spirochaetes bacterium]|nr:hypothetical protein [Spirochaetota bacterium]
MDSDATRVYGDNYLIVKGRFKSPSMNLYGQIMIIFKNENTIDSYAVVASTYSEIYNMEPHEEWNRYEEYIADVKWKGNFNANITHSIMDHIKALSDEVKLLKEFYQSVYKYDYSNVDITIFDLINRVLHDKSLILETGIQEVTQRDYYETKKNRDKKGEEEPAQKSEGSAATEDAAVILPVKPIVSPVRGKPIYELKIGDKIIIKIQAISDRANYFIDLLDLREDKQIRPIPAEVIDIKAGSGKKDPVEILTLIGSGIYGKFTEEEKQVKLRIYDPSIDGPIKKKILDASMQQKMKSFEPRESGPGLSKGTIFMLLLFVIILALFIVLIFISW